MVEGASYDVSNTLSLAGDTPVTLAYPSSPFGIGATTGSTATTQRSTSDDNIVQGKRTNSDGVEIRDNDSAVISIVSGVSFSENSIAPVVTAKLTFNVSSGGSGPFGLAKSASFTIDDSTSGSAAEIDDFTSFAQATLEFDTTTSSVDFRTTTLPITFLNDRLLEGDETINFKLSDLNVDDTTIDDRVSLDSTSTGAGVDITIQDNESATLKFVDVISPDTDPDEKDEGQTSTRSVELTIVTNDASGDYGIAYPITVQMSTTGSTAIAADYNFVAVTFEVADVTSASSTKTLSVSLVDDAIVDGDETAIFEIKGASTTATTVPSNYLSLITATDDKTHQINIKDQDAAFVRVTATAATATEEANNNAPAAFGMLTFSLKNDDSGTSDVIVDLATTITFTIQVSTASNASVANLTEADFRLEISNDSGATWAPFGPSSGSTSSILTYTLPLAANTSSRVVRVVALNENSCSTCG